MHHMTEEQTCNTNVQQDAIKHGGAGCAHTRPTAQVGLAPWAIHIHHYEEVHTDRPQPVPRCSLCLTSNYLLQKLKLSQEITALLTGKSRICAVMGILHGRCAIYACSLHA